MTIKKKQTGGKISFHIYSTFMFLFHHIELTFSSELMSAIFGGVGGGLFFISSKTSTDTEIRTYMNNVLIIKYFFLSNAC